MIYINCQQPCGRSECDGCLRVLREGDNEPESQVEFELFFGKHYRLDKIRRVREEHRKLNWNLWAALFHVVWFGYRKHYKPALLFVVILLLIDAAAYYMGWNHALPMLNITPIFLGTLILGMLFFGFFADSLYYRHAVRTICKIRERMYHQAEQRLLLRGKGGTSGRGAIVMLAIMIAIFFLSHTFFPTSADIINTVRTGSLYEHPLYPIGESFNQYFYDTKWEYNRAANGLELVEFHGNTKDESRDHVIIQFLVDYHLHSIELYTIEINGVMQNEEQIRQLMDEVFQVENPFELDNGPENGKQAL